MLALALRPTDPDIKASYQDLAMEWRELAALFEDSDNRADGTSPLSAALVRR
jgi:hypothetical protein